VTDRSSTETSQPSPDAVRRSLRALADGSTPGRPQDFPDTGPGDTASSPPATSIETTFRPPPEAVVRDAERATADAQAAAAFLSTERLPQLDAAITTAAARGDDESADRGRAAKRSLRRLDAALER
jgi:hypothetical protein